ncbi:MAG: bifunctional folylpolyglutamate synthase/ dihydrofolate synthase [Desulfovibrio sp.]|nr:bifunctional folylpolyglutamate synthase/ dihydrofolate synthase [Desulfovibrio sp.]
MRGPFKDIHDVEAHLHKVGLFHQDMRLERMYAALETLALKRPSFKIAQVLGTNGKGSTATFLAALCQSHGCRTGLYTSPHFVSPQERIHIDGHPVPPDLWVEGANRIMGVAPDLTYFEFLTVLALLLFTRCAVDVAVMEAGLGGRHDATTATAADLLCFTPIAMDHGNVLGSSLTAIATDKAAAIRSPAPVCTARQYPLAAAILHDAAQKQGARLLQADPLPSAYEQHLGLAGQHQLTNAGLAFSAWQALAPLLRKKPDSSRQQQALSAAFVPGRLQYAPAGAGHPPLLLDGAHNPHGMRALTATLTAALPSGKRPSTVIFSCLGDKDWHTVARQLHAALPEAPVFIPSLHNPRAADATEIAAFWNSLPAGATAHCVSQTHEALRMAAAHRTGEGPVLITGSLYLLAEVFALFPHLLHSSSSRTTL